MIVQVSPIDLQNFEVIEVEDKTSSNGRREGSFDVLHMVSFVNLDQSAYLPRKQRIALPPEESPEATITKFNRIN